MRNIKFSLIIPVYNVEKYLPDCLASIQAQTYNNFEAIFVDDGSTDNSNIILQRFYEKVEKNTFPCYKIIRQENRGVSAARNNALQYAEGEYIFFLIVMMNFLIMP